MDVLENMGKIAGIGGLALGTFLLLFREVIRKNIFSGLTRDQSYKLIRLILILVWTIAILGIVSWLLGPLIGQPKTTGNKLVVTMDSPLLVYDRENDGTGRTNTDEIANALKDVKGVSLVQVSTNLEWSREEEVRSKNPDLVILHMSAFASETVSHDQPAALTRLISVLEYLKDSKAQFLIYSRYHLYEDEIIQKGWIDQVEKKDPELQGRIHFFNFVPGKPKLFRDPEVQRALKMQVKSLLKIV
jgi:hypothetical protein